ACHQLTSDQRGYAPINFDQHCATCHIKDSVLTLDGNNPLVSGFTFGDVLMRNVPGANAPSLGPPDARGRVKFGGVGHRDAWVRANADRLTRTLAAQDWARDRSR